MAISCLSLIQLLSDLHFFQGVHPKKRRWIYPSEFIQNSKTRKGCMHFSNRLLDAIASHCVPYEDVLDEIELPYEDVLDYLEFCVLIRRHIRFSQKGFLGPFGCSL
ncbi:hypothetical protein ZOSMA_597G00020 [Zostera marina]|uniref:Uncharacterized protein n=1 Tax=Zostera marina TaxID=29655 RepID=A0A0K9NWV3_ZOSMR|nr:hypothetical protein ZOSMA_597G00020 [Zostera marina]